MSCASIGAGNADIIKFCVKIFVASKGVPKKKTVFQKIAFLESSREGDFLFEPAAEVSGGEFKSPACPDLMSGLYQDKRT